MKRFVSAIPALTFLVNLIFPVWLGVSMYFGMYRYPVPLDILVPLITVLSAILSCVWFASACSGNVRIRFGHVALGLLVAALALFNGMTFLKYHVSVWTTVFVALLWIGAADILLGCIGAVSNKRLACLLSSLSTLGIAYAASQLYPVMNHVRSTVCFFERLF